MAMSVQAAPKPTTGNIWMQLTRPHPSITDIEMRRQTRLLAGVILAILFTSTFAFLWLLRSSGGVFTMTMTTLVPAQIIMVILYIANRNGYYTWSARGVVALHFFVVHVSLLATDDIVWLLFASSAVLLAALFTPARVTMGVFIASVVIQLIFSNLYPRQTLIGNSGAFIIYLMTSSLVLVFIQHRTRLEQERQAELQAINEQLRLSEAVLEQRVKERTAELEIARDQALEADRTKSQFLASMSHELRTPLNSILTFNELMAMGTFGDVNDEQKDYLHKSLQSGKHLLSLINDVLDMTKIQSGMLKLFLESDFDIAKEMKQIAATVEKLLHDKPVQFIVQTDGIFAPLTCDKRRVRQILLNLISNAIKFTENGSITLNAQYHSDEIIFSVTDTGPGIDQEQQDIIFEPFIQTETGVKHAGGTGLGLPISKQLALAHGGRLWVESQIGMGATFYLALPTTIQSIPVSKEKQV